MAGVDVAVMRRGTEGLGMKAYAEALQDRLPGYTVVHAATPQQEIEFGSNATVVTGDAMPREALERNDRLAVFACTFAGVDHLPLARFEQRGVTVTNASGIHSIGIAEQVIGGILTFARGLSRTRYGSNSSRGASNDLFTVAGKTVTIVGLGAIGTAVGNRLAGFDVTRIGVRHSPEKDGPVDDIIGYDRSEFERVLARSDVVVLSCPLTEITTKLIDENAFSVLPSTAILINVARGGVIDTPALVRALKTNEIRGAYLDVTQPEPLPPEHPLWTFDNCRITPHMGGHTSLHWERLAEIVASNLQRLENGEPLRNVV